MKDMMPLFLRVAHQMLNDWHLAQDAVSETFVKLYRKKDAFKGDSQFKTFGYRVLVNHCIDSKRKKDRWWRIFDRGHSLEEIPGQIQYASPFHNASSNETFDRLNEMLVKLTPRQKAASILFFFEEMSLQETADIMNISVGTVKALIFQSRQILKDQWKGGMHE